MELSELKVLIVDDMADVRESLRTILANEGITEIDQAEDGDIAWEKINSIPYTMIFCDINMPNMNGLDLLKKIKTSNDYQSIPVVMVTTENEKDVIMEAVMYGASNYVIKPFKEDIIKLKLYETINGKKK